MTKRLIIDKKIENCYECVYGKYLESFDIYICKANEGIKITNPASIPDFCPLEDA